MKLFKYIIICIFVIIIFNGCESEVEKEKRIFSYVMINDNIKSKIKNEIIQNEVLSINQTGNSELISDVKRQIRKEIKIELYQNEREKILKDLKKDKKLKNKLYQEAKNELYKEYKRSPKLNSEINKKVKLKLEKELLNKELYNKKVEETISSIDNLIHQIDLTEEKYYPQICKSIYNFSEQVTGSREKECEVQMRDGKFVRRYYEQLVILNKYVSEGELKDILNVFKNYDQLVKTRINTILKLKKMKEKYLVYQEKLFIMNTELKVARTLKGSAMIEIEKELNRIMRDLDKEISKSNIK